MSTSAWLTFRFVEEMTVLNDQTEVILEMIEMSVFVAINFLLHRAEVHRMRDEFVVRRNLQKKRQQMCAKRDYDDPLTWISSTGSAK